MAHNVQRFDVQPSVDQNNLVIFVVGQVKVRAPSTSPRTRTFRSHLPTRPFFLYSFLSYLSQMQLEGQDNPLQFAEFFQLVASAPGQFYIHNQVFRLIYG